MCPLILNIHNVLTSNPRKIGKIGLSGLQGLEMHPDCLLSLRNYKLTL